MKTCSTTHSLWLTCIAVSLSCCLNAYAGKRNALVIGNNEYKNARALVNPKNDATSMANALEKVGFEVVLRVDADLKTSKAALREFIDNLPKVKSPDTVALVYFAGHGVQIAGQNYLIPIDATMARDYEVPDETVSMESIIRGLETAGAGLNLLILDSCRNNPFSRSWRGTRSADSGGLAIPKGAPQGMFIAFSTSPGDVAEDGEGENSPYTEALLKHLPTPEKSFEEVFKLVGRDVSEVTGGDQQPWFNSKFYGNFTFATEAGGSTSDSIDPGIASVKRPWKNSMGLEFIPVPGKSDVLMARTETRVRDFRSFANDSDFQASEGAHIFKAVEKEGGGFTTDWVLDKKASWELPGFAQSSNHPVSCVNWRDAKAFCAWLSKKEGRTYRLPTDSEWSAAANTGTKYPWGNEFPPKKDAGNYWDLQAIKNLPGRWEKSVFNGHPYDDGAERTARVGSYPANQNGFFDLGGNLWEWCEDAYKVTMNDPAVLAAHPVLNEEKAPDGTPHRVIRGAAWDNFIEANLRTEFRDFDGPERRDDDYGFRVVLEID